MDEFSGRRWRSGETAIASFAEKPEVRCARGTSADDFTPADYSLGRVAAPMGDVKPTGATR